MICCCKIFIVCINYPIKYEQYYMSELIRKQQKLNYRINYCSSEDKQFPASELILLSEDSIGWQSKRFSSYPQLIVIELFELSFIREVSILSHQTKITTKIQIQAKKEHSETWTRLGYTCMDSNVNNNYRCRELKKVPLNNQQALILRFTMHQNYTNNQNIFNQVGIINLSIHGAKKSTQIKQVPISLLDKLTLTKLKQLEKLKAEAIQENQFDLAKHYNNQIKNLKETANQLMCLEKNKKSAIEQDNFEEAKKINQKMVRIRGPSLTPRINSSINENKNQLSHEYDRYNQSHEMEKNQHSNGKYPQLNSAQYAPTSQYSHNNDEEIIITEKKKQNHLNSQQYDQCQQYFEVIPKNIFQQLHSKDQIEREDGLYKVKQIIQSNVNVSKQNILSAGLYIINKMIDDKVLSISIKAISIFGVMLRKYNFQKINANQADVIRSIMIKLNPFLGHKNEKIKTLASNVYISLPKYPITNRQLCIDVLTIIGMRNPRNIIVQLGILQTIINQYGLPKNIHKVIKFPVIFIEDRDNLVRQKAINFLLFLRDKIGFQNLLPYLQNIHPAITNVLKLEKLEENNPKQQITQKKNSVPLTQKIVKKKKTQQEKKKNSVIEKSERKIAVNPEYVCDYCQVMDKKLEDENYRDIHLFKQCKMIKICPECKQAIEISQLNQHLLLECRQKGKYRRCPRCKQPIHIQQYQRHCMNKDCLPAKSFSSSNRCPLCHQDILPHKKGWLRHLVDQGCPLNNRT